jgi:hypothetical protein
MLDNKLAAKGWIQIAISVVVIGCNVAHAQLVNCSDPGPPDVFKIFIDEVRATGGSSSNFKVQERLQTIHKFLSENLKASAAEKASVRDCGKRFPNDPSDFDNTEFNGLDNLRVVLEVWGVMDDPTRGSGSVGFALVPARPIAPPAVYVIPVNDLLTSFRQGKKMSAFAPLVLGIRQYQNKNYADAVPLLCAGTQQLASVLTGQGALGDTRFRARQQELIERIKEISDDAIREARKMPRSPYALLTPSSDGSFTCPQ